MTPLCPTLHIYRLDIVCQNLQLRVFDNPDGTFYTRNFFSVWLKQDNRTGPRCSRSIFQDFQRHRNMIVKTRCLSVLLLYWKLCVFTSTFCSVGANLSSSLKSYIRTKYYDVETVNVKHSPALSVAVLLSLARLPGKVTDRETHSSTDIWARY